MFVLSQKDAHHFSVTVHLRRFGVRDDVRDAGLEILFGPLDIFAIGDLRLGGVGMHVRIYGDDVFRDAEDFHDGNPNSFSEESLSEGVFKCSRGL